MSNLVQKLLLLVAVGVLLLAITMASPAVDSKPPTQILYYEVENMPNSYKFHYDSSDGSSRTEAGSILYAGTDNAALDVLGTVRWYDNKGQLYEMTYKAGKKGYRTKIRKVKS